MTEVYEQLVILTLVLMTSWISWAGPSIPEYLSTSFAGGIVNNAGITRDDLVRMNRALNRLKGPSENSIDDAKVNELSMDDLKSFAVQPFQIEYIEIPEKNLIATGNYAAEVSEYINTDSISPIRFKKNGEIWVRWFIHPMRTDVNFRKFLGQAPIKRGRFLGQLTESRSVLLYDNQKQRGWTIKLSLPEGVGQFQSKVYPLRDAQVHFKSSEAILRSKALSAESDLGILPEQEFIGLKSDNYDEAQAVRNIDVLTPSKRFKSFSSLMTSNFYRQGLDWDEKSKTEWLARKPGKLAALIYLKLGLLHNSNHSQNSVILFGEDGKPEKVFLRDPDFELDRSHPNSEATHAQIPNAYFNRPAYVDYSMLNGMKE